MALVKYNPMIIKPRKSSTGFTFSNTSRMNVTKPVAKIVHHRTQLQLHYNSVFIYLSRIWRTLSTDSKNSWGSFASAIPQPTKFSDTKYLSGFQCFVRRNYYLILETGSFDDLMLTPNTTVYENDPPEISLSLSSDSLIVNLTFARNVSDLRCHIYASAPLNSSVNYNGNNYRYMLSVDSYTQSVDITEQYLKAFEYLPQAINEHTQIVIDYVNCAKLNGQLWFHTSKRGKLINQDMGIYYRNDMVHYSKSIAAAGWRVPTAYDYILNWNYFGGLGNAGDNIRIENPAFWNYYGLPSDNASLLSFKGSGIYYPELDYFAEVKDTAIINTSTIDSSGNCAYFQLNSEFANIVRYDYPTLEHSTLRVGRVNLSMPPGTRGVYIGNDGREYETVCWNFQEIICENLKETKFSDGSDIPIVYSAQDFIDSAVPCGTWLNYIPHF